MIQRFSKNDYIPMSKAEELISDALKDQFPQAKIKVKIKKERGDSEKIYIIWDKGPEMKEVSLVVEDALGGWDYNRYGYGIVYDRTPREVLHVPRNYPQMIHNFK